MKKDRVTKSPVALIIFNRAELTRKVFGIIAAARPEKLFIIADGPRIGNEDDVQKCEATRKVVENVDWDCEVHRNYSDVNLGCGVRPASGISWVFEHTDRAVILEDDCIPDPGFFRFCDELLERYKDDERVMQINGMNFQIGERRTEDSYYFSRFPLTWGWATWKRAWDHYDYGISQWADLRKTDFPMQITGNEDATTYWRHNFEDAWQKVQAADYHAWDYQWTLIFWTQNGLSVSPRDNLVSNIGFGEEATHTKSKNNVFGYSPLVAMEFPLTHPANMLPNIAADQFFVSEVAKKVRYVEKRRKSHLRKLRNRSVRMLLSAYHLFLAYSTSSNSHHHSIKMNSEDTRIRSEKLKIYA
jgi:hypothetical protein